jgi:pimeloyl-ACP methyl ester carboxylesterase
VLFGRTRSFREGACVRFEQLTDRAVLNKGALTREYQPTKGTIVNPVQPVSTATRHHRERIAGFELFWREAGNPVSPTIVLLPGHPSSSHAYTGLIDQLSGRWHVIAPDYPGYGFSEAPAHTAWTFDLLAEVVDALLEHIGLERYVLYMFDFGAPVGMRIATAHPDRIDGLISQNGNIALEGLGDAVAPLGEWWGDRAAHQRTVDAFLSAAGTRTQWEAGLQEPAAADPALWRLDAALLAEPERHRAAEALLWDYQNNPPAYPGWQEYLAAHRPPVLAIWGARDPFFIPAGAEAFRTHQPDADVVLLDTGHFALVEELGTVASHIERFLDRVYPQLG